MRLGVEARLAVVAGCVAAAGIAALPFAGGWGPSMETVVAGGLPTTTTMPAPAPEPAPSPEPAPAPVAPIVEPPRVDVSAIDAGMSSPVGPGSSGDIAVVPTLPPAAVSAPSYAPASQSRIWAAVIGVDDYPGSDHDLQAAVADADSVVASLLGNGVPASQVLELRNQEVTSATLVAAADWLVANVDADDTAVFFFAGHVRDTGGPTQVAVTSEGGWVTDWYLANHLAGLRSRDAWMVIAACFGGGFDELLEPGRVLTAAAGPGQLAYESQDFHKSYMVNYLFDRAVLGREAPAGTVQAAVGWAMDHLAQDYPRFQLWNVDESDHPISLSQRPEASTTWGQPPGGVPTPEPPAPPPTVPPPPERCLLILRCG